MIKVKLIERKKDKNSYTKREVLEEKEIRKNKNYTSFIRELSKAFSIPKNEFILMLLTKDEDEYPIINQEDMDDYLEEAKEFMIIMEEGYIKTKPAKIEKEKEKKNYISEKNDDKIVNTKISFNMSDKLKNFSLFPNPQSELIELNTNNLGYNCSECSSLIEILSINENNNTIEFNCINSHNYNKVKIKEYLQKMKQYNDNKNISEKCENHKNAEYINFCFDCKLHLCKECLKSKIHKNHKKINIFELQPSEEDLKLIRKKIEYYNNNISNKNLEKENKVKEFKNILDNDNIKENQNLNKRIEIFKLNRENELKINKKKYIDDIKKIKRKYEEEKKKRKIKYEKENKNIEKKYKLINDKEIIINKYKIREINNKYINKINNLIYIYKLKIDNIFNIKKLNELIYNAYYVCNNNYYYSININHICKLKFKEENLNEEINGKGNEYYNDNELQFEREYLNLERNVKVKEYYDNDKLKFEGQYLYGKRNGKGKEYNLDGELIFEGEYLNGKRNGNGKEYNYNGLLEFEGEYFDGKRNGKGKEYYEKGKLKFEGEYFKGKRWNGKGYNINGKSDFQIKDGIGKGKEYNYFGKLVFEGEFLNGERKIYNYKEIVENLKELNKIEFYIENQIKSISLKNISKSDNFYMVNKKCMKELKTFFDYDNIIKNHDNINILFQNQKFQDKLNNIDYLNTELDKKIYHDANVPINFEIFDKKNFDLITKEINNKNKIKLEFKYYYNIYLGDNKIFVQDNDNKFLYFIYSLNNKEYTLDYIIKFEQINDIKNFISNCELNEKFEDLIIKYGIKLSSQGDQILIDDNYKLIGKLKNIKSKQIHGKKDPNHCLGLQNIGAT